MSTEQPFSHSGNPASVPAIKVIGLGGAGGQVAALLAAAQLPGVTCAAVNTDQQALAMLSGLPTHLLGSGVTRGLSAGGDAKLGALAAEADEAELRGLVAGAGLVFIIAGLGGGTGSGAAPSLARLAREAGALVLGVVVMPFDFEGSRRQRQAILALARLREEADAVIRLSNQHLLKQGDERQTVLAWLARANTAMAEAVVGLWRMLTLPGLMNLDFNSLREAVAGRHAESRMGSAEAVGDQRAFEVWDGLCQHPEFADAQSWEGAETVLVSLVGGPDLITAEMEWIMSQVQARASQARILMGAVVEPSFAGKLSVTLVATQATPLLAETRVAAVAVAPGAKETAVKDDAPTEVGGSLQQVTATRGRSRFTAPAPNVSAERAQQMYRRQTGRLRRKKEPGLQGMLPLEIVSKGRFEKSEPTVRGGEDLDVPTFVRRGVVLN
jgi:cell division protein FtsZ